MPRIVFEGFTGLSPRKGFGRGGLNESECAVNTKTWDGNLSSFPCPELVCSRDFNIKTLYQLKDCECVAWDVEVDIARAGDFIFWTGDGKPRFATQAELCNGEFCYLGVPCPTNAPSTSSSGGDCDPQFGVFVYRYRNKYGHVGAPSLLSQAIELGNGTTLSGIQTPDSGHCITHIDVFGAVAGTKTGLEANVLNNAGMMYYGAFPIGSSVSFNSSPIKSGFELDSLSFYPPPADLKGIVSTRMGLAGYSGSNVCYTEAGEVSAWGKWKSVDCDIKTIAYWNNRLFVWDVEGNIYQMQEQVVANDYTFSDPFLYGGQKFMLVSDQNGISIGQAGIYFPSTHGIALVNDNQVQYVTNIDLAKDDWCAIQPETIRTELFDYGLGIFAKNRSFVYEVQDGKFGETQGNFYELPFKVDATFVDRDGVLNYSQGFDWYRFDPCVDVNPQTECGIHRVCACRECCDYLYRSKQLIADNYMKLSAGFIEFYPYFGDVTLKLIEEDCGAFNTIFEKTFDASTENCVRGTCYRKYFRLPLCRARDNLILELSGCATVRRVALGTSRSALAG